jgi:hypothetical protein
MNVPPAPVHEHVEPGCERTMIHQAHRVPHRFAEDFGAVVPPGLG